MDSDSEDYVVIGTSFEREESSRSYRQKKPSASSLATTKALPAHLQVPTDAEGRRRFHGAFEGGFSAGYFNTVGSKEGWAPSAFRSSRGARAPANDERSRAEAYMDDDEREALQASRLEATDAFDTFGEGAMRKAQRQFAGVAGPSRAEGGGGIIPGPVPGELVVAVADPAAQRLLRLMGWRPGKGIGRRRDEHTDGLFDRSRESVPDDDRLFETEQISLRPAPPVPKLDRHGFGYDPFEGAEEFRVLAASRLKRRNAHPRGLGAGNAPTRGEAFGVGVFEDPDEDAAAFFENDARDDVGHFYEIPASASESGSDSDADARFSARRDDGNLGDRGGDEKKKKSSLGSWCVRGFVVSKHTLAPTKWYPPPVVPRGFDGRHAFPDENAAPAPRDVVDRTETAAAAVPSVAPPPPPPPPPPPSDASVKKFIDTTAHFVAKNGAWFEQMAREKQRADPRFAFLRDPASSSAARYYAWRLRTSRAELSRNAGDAAAWAGRHAMSDISTIAVRRRPLHVDDRARALGEEPLPARGHKGVDVTSVAAGDRTKIASALSGAFVAGAVEGSLGGDGVWNAGGTRDGKYFPGSLPAGLTDAASLLKRKELIEREKTEARLEAERAAAAAREAAAPTVSTRTSFDWAPAALLCKRFGVPDPFELGDGRVRPTNKQTGSAATFRSKTFLEGALAETEKQKNAAEEKEAPNFSLKKSARDEKAPPTAEATETPPPLAPSEVSDEAEAFLRGLFFKKQIFEDSDDEAEAEKRADRAEAEEEKRTVEEAAAAAPPPPPPPLPRPDATRKRESENEANGEDPSGASSRKRRKKEKRRDKKAKAKERRREKKRREKKKKKSGKKRRRSERRGSSESSDSSDDSSDVSSDD